MTSLETLRPATELAADKPHGTRMKYKGGCKCTPCRAANSRYETERLAARKCGMSNEIVDAGKARRHLQFLSKNGIGRDTVSDIAGIAVTTINKIRTGERHGIRKNNERKILSVTVEAISDGHFVDAKPTWSKIRWLLSEGFTYAKLSERLGYKSPTAVYNIGKNLVKAATALKVEKFYNTIRLGEEEEFYPDDLNNFLSE